MNRVVRLVELIAGLFGVVIFYLVSPLLVYAVASGMKVNRGMDNRFADFLDVIYEPAQRLTEQWDAYDRFIVWCIKITGQT